MNIFENEIALRAEGPAAVAVLNHQKRAPRDHRCAAGVRSWLRRDGQPVPGVRLILVSPCERLIADIDASGDIAEGGARSCAVQLSAHARSAVKQDLQVNRPLYDRCRASCHGCMQDSPV